MIFLILLLFCLVFAAMLCWQRKLREFFWLEAHAISLPGQDARRTTLERRFAGQGIRVRFFDAVDTREGGWNAYTSYLTEKGRKALVNTVKTGLRRDHAELTPGAIGCFLSHLALLEELSSKNRVCLVLEDDSDPIPSFRKDLRAILRHFPQDADLFLLSYQVVGSLIPVTRLPYPAFLLSRSSSFWLLNCYLVSPRGARKILDYFRRVKKSRFEAQLDSFLSAMIHEGVLRVYIPDRQLCPQDNTFPTSIQGFEVV